MKRPAKAEMRDEARIKGGINKVSKTEGEQKRGGDDCNKNRKVNDKNVIRLDSEMNRVNKSENESGGENKVSGEKVGEKLNKNNVPRNQERNSQKRKGGNREEEPLAKFKKQIENVKSNNTLKYIVINLRGYSSKKMSFNNILDSGDYDFVILTETHLYGESKPKHKDYNFIVKNRPRVNGKGGVAIGYKKELSDSVVKIFEGTDGNEFLLVQVNGYSETIVLGVYYGAQEQTAAPGKINRDLGEVVSEIYKNDQLGRKVFVAGDFNIHIGEIVLPGNDPSVTKGGKVFLEMCEEMGLELVNKKWKGNPRTHFDVSSGTSRTLDLVVTNCIDDHENFVIDHERKVTPYTMKVSGQNVIENHCDHVAMTGELKVERKKKLEKIKKWNTAKPGGKKEFRRLTDEAADELYKIIKENPNVNVMMKKIKQLIDRLKRAAFGLRTVTKKKQEREDNEKLMLKRTDALSKEVETMNTDRLRQSERVFKARKKVLANNDDELLEVLKNHKTGGRMATAEEIFKDALDYNVKVLEKNENTSEESKELRKEKEEVVRACEEFETEESEKPLRWEEYLSVVEDVLASKKGCYSDFAWAGPRWKATLFLMFQRLYMGEVMPKEFRETRLKKLYKRKGPKSELSSYRFIHLKQWAPKIMEKIVMKRIKGRMQRNTPEMQIGGRAESRTVEHIGTVLAVCDMEMKEKGGIVKQDFDIKKCFDQVWLSDTLYDVASCGVSGKELRVIKKLSEEIEISVVGDPGKNKALIKNSTGQGTGYAPPACSLTMAATLDRKFKQKGGEMEVGGMMFSPLMFVDDASRMTRNAEQARDGGKTITESLDELALQAHDQKSVQVVMGGKKFRDEMTKQLEENPVKVQGFDMRVVPEEVYLGFCFSQDSKKSKTRSIEIRMAKVKAKTAQAKGLLTDDLIQRVGWLQAVQSIYQSEILATALYAAEVYTNLTQKQLNMIESGLKESLYTMLEVSQYTNYAAVLSELNLVKVNHSIASLQITFLNSLMHEKKSGYYLHTLKVQEEKYPGSGLIGEVKRLCRTYGLPDVSEIPLEKEVIKEAIKTKARRELWLETLKVRKVPLIIDELKSNKLYWHYPKREAMLVFNYKVGQLEFKNYRRQEMKRKFGDINCVKGCEEPDDLEHVKSCGRYRTKWTEKTDSHPKYLVEFLKDLESERLAATNFKLPLVYRRER